MTEYELRSVAKTIEAMVIASCKANGISVDGLSKEIYRRASDKVTSPTPGYYFLPSRAFALAPIALMALGP